MRESPSSPPSARPEEVRRPSPIVEGDEEHDLVVGLVGAVGTDMSWVEAELIAHLKNLSFAVEGISLNSLIATEYCDKLPAKDAIPYNDYVKNRMDAGTALRHHWNDPAALSRLAVERIASRREELSSADVKRRAFVLRSLKRPEEVRLLAEVYRTQFVLIGCHAPRTTRIEALADRIACSHDTGDTAAHRWRAEWLTTRDQHEHGDAATDPEARQLLERYGQRTRDTYPLADAYVNLYTHTEAARALRRFCNLVLGDPFISPSRDEVAMFHAQAAATRSTDLSRQVGAAIANHEGDIIAVGCNEVPRARGGAYWEGDEPDARDFQRGRDGNQDQRDRALREIYHVLERREMLSSVARKEGVAGFLASMQDTRVDGLIEFSRSVHAEMAALLDAARRGVSVQNAVLYTSTFPCHNCAKHIVAAGITRVVFIEPYPKSLAEQLHGDSLAVDERSASRDVVNFEHFEGVAPTNYFPLFRAHGKRKDGEGLPLRFSFEHVTPKLDTMFHRALKDFEVEVVEELAEARKHGTPHPNWLNQVPDLDDIRDPRGQQRTNARAPGSKPSPANGKPARAPHG